jgi:hypothetical protein
VFFEEERRKRVVQQSHGAPAGPQLDRILDVAYALGAEHPGRTA